MEKPQYENCDISGITKNIISICTDGAVTRMTEYKIEEIERYIKQVRESVLKAVLPEENEEPLSEKNIGWNNCREDVIKKAEDLYNIKL